MESFESKNITLLINNNEVEKMSKKQFRLVMYPLAIGLYKKYIGFITGIKKDNDVYSFVFNGKTYTFKQLSDLDISNEDKRILLSPKYKKGIESFFRSLKLTCSLDLVNPRFVVATSLSNKFDILILFNEDGEEKVICYEKNIVMPKKDYYELYKVKEINVLDKYELYRIYMKTKDLGSLLPLFYYIIFSKEILEEETIYDEVGINRNNHVIYEDSSDDLYNFESKQKSENNISFIDLLNQFTINPTILPKYIRKQKTEDNRYKYYFNDGKHKFSFYLLSDITSDELKKELLSEARYHRCHSMSRKLGYNLLIERIDAYIVSGKTKRKDNLYYNHSWIEVKNKNQVIDFTLNIIMDKDEYYDVMGIIPISINPVKEYFENLKFLVENHLCSSLIFFNYFGSDIVRDLERNKQLFKKKND